VFFANFIATDGTATVEWQRGQVEVRDSPGTAGAGSVTLTTPLTWSGYTFTGTAAAGPYRAGTNVTFSSSTGGAVAINSADTLGALTPTAGRLIYGNGSAWTVLAPGTVGQVLAMGASLPAWASAGAGDITGGAVTGGLLTVSEAAGILTYGLTTTAVRNATAIYLPLVDGGEVLGEVTLSGGAYFGAGGDVTFANGAFLQAAALEVTNGADINMGVGSVITGDGSGLTNLDATDLLGDIPAASFGEERLEFRNPDFHLVTSEQVGYAQYVLTSGSPANALTIHCAKSANTAEQDFVWRSCPIVIPRGFVAFKTKGAIDIDWVSDDATNVADIRGIRLVRYASGSPTTLYTDATTRNVSGANTITNISLDRSAFAATTVSAGDLIVLEITGTIEDSKCFGILHACIHSE